ncbi:hypothetical protein [Pseudomonas sp. NPDC089534]|uniref:hypothetical protein n=1 Tax=Pseudomonas sp. NPDC089534 TaxID=3364468 RepID=UPI0038237A44
MSNHTAEELAIQILSTCLLVTAQGKWHAHFQFAAHVGWIEVRVRPSTHNYDSGEAPPPAAMKWATISGLNPSLCYSRPTEEDARQNLMKLLAWVQSHLDMGTTK